MFLRSEYPKLVAAVALVAGGRAAGEDAVQEALARAWERSERGLHIESLGAWVTTVAMNLARSRWRRRQAEARATQRLPSPPASPRTGEEDLDLRAALEALPRRQREVTVLRYFLGYPVTEIAGILGISEGTVKTSLHRARAKLADALGEKEEDHAPAR